MLTSIPATVVARAVRRFGLIAATAVLLTGCGGSSTDELKAGLLAANKPGDAAVDVASTGADAAAKTAAVAPTKTAGTTKVSAAVLKDGGKVDVAKIDEMKAVVTPGSTAYRIGTLDVLEVSVFKVPELSKTAQVSDTGSITYPLLGDVPAAGRTAQELEREITKKLAASYLQKPQVTVLVKEYNSQRVLVDGSVVKPGVYPVQGKASLIQFIALSGGLTTVADSTVVVFRTVDGKKTAARFDLEDIRSGNAQDPPIQAGDVIVASNSAFKEGFEKLLKVIPLAGVFALL